MSFLIWAISSPTSCWLFVGSAFLEDDAGILCSERVNDFETVAIGL
jgi:hypothetical protein